MIRLLDCHSHILPGIDDGSKTVEMSIEMLQKEAEQGIDAVLATPHFYAAYDTPEHFLAKRAKAEVALREEMGKYQDLPALFVGAEVSYFSGISESKAISELTIAGSRCILIEMPMCPWNETMYRELEGLYIKRGLIPVVAHIDRYIGRFHNRGVLKRLEQLPVLIQANAEFFLERSTSSMALRMVKKNQIHLLGSDCHNLTSRSPQLGLAVDVIEKRLGDGALAEIRKCQQQVLQDAQ